MDVSLTFPRSPFYFLDFDFAVSSDGPSLVFISVMLP